MFGSSSRDVSAGLDRAGLKVGSVLFAVALMASSCGAEEDPHVDGPVGRGGSCSVQQDCFDCPGCRAPHAEVCVDGMCWLSGLVESVGDDAPMLGSFNVLVEIPRAVDASRIKSVAIRVMHPSRTHGALATCDELMANPLHVDADPLLNRLRVLEPPVALGTRDDIANLGVGHVPVGDGRLFFVRTHALANGNGSVVTVGCTEDVTVLEGAGQKVIVATTKPD